MSGMEPVGATALPKVVAITLNWNGLRWIGDCLSALLAMHYANLEVVMVDNGSTDGSVQFVRDKFPSVGVVETGHNLGYARGFNVGLEFAATRAPRYFFILNNDTVVDPGALGALVETATSQDHAGFVGGKVYFYDRPDTLQTVGKREDPIRWNGAHIGWAERDVGQFEEVEERAFIDHVVTLVDRRLYDEIGGYDPQFFLQCEEFDWEVRAKKAGWKFYYTPKAKAWHRVSMSMGGIGNPIGRYFDTRSAMVVMARHAGLRKFLRFYVHTAYRLARSMLGGVVRHDPSVLKPRLAALLGHVSGTLWLVHRRPATEVPWIIRMLT